MIALNFGARFFAILLIFFVAGGDLLLPRFLESVAARQARTLIDALKNLSIIGALFMIAGYGRGRAASSLPMATSSAESLKRRAATA